MLILILAVIILLFGFVILFGAPYLPTKKRQITIALKMLKANKDAVIVDLGSGDGAFLRAAAKEGVTVYGYELNPLLCMVAWLRCYRYRQQVHIRLANFWHTSLPKDTTGVYTFLLHRYMKRLDKKLDQEAQRLGHSLSLASFTFPIPSKKAVEVEEGVFLYHYKH